MSDDGIDLELLDLLGLAEPPRVPKQPKFLFRNSATRFLRQIYTEIEKEKEEPGPDDKRHRHKRTSTDDENFITVFDRTEMDKCNNFITFASKKKPLRKYSHDFNAGAKYLQLFFNTNNVPSDLHLIHSTLRIYRDLRDHSLDNFTISVFERISFQSGNISDYRILSSINMTSTYKGWMELNITRPLSRWIKFRKFRPPAFLNDLLISTTVTTTQISSNPSDVGLIYPQQDRMAERNPFIIGYFEGPELVEKMHKLRFRREIMKRKRKANTHLLSPSEAAGLQLQYSYQLPKTCERLNFTVNFKETHMDSFIIAPKKFEAYFCGGECNFPLGAQMNATNHAIVQTLMQLKQAHLPKPCCVPTALDSITILHYLNEDNVNLVKFPQSVVKQCGCH